MNLLRFRKVAKLRRCDLIMNNIFLFISIENNRTDIYREESYIYLTKLNSVLHAIELASQYFNTKCKRLEKMHWYKHVSSLRTGRATVASNLGVNETF